MTQPASPSILVIGATGNVGSEVVRQLAATGTRPRIYVRDPAKAARLLGEANYELHTGELSDADAIATAMSGIQSLYMVTFESEAYLDYLATVLSAAKAARAKRIVLMSAMSDENSDVPFLRLHGLMERQVRESGLEFTILHPDWFMQNFLASAGQAEIPFPAGSGKVSFIDVRDIAAVAIKALSEPGHHGKVYDLSGPEALTYGEAVARLAEGSGYPFRYLEPSPEEYRAGMIARGYDAAYADLIIDITAPMRLGMDSLPTDTVVNVLGRTPISLRQFAADHADVLHGR